MYFSPAKPLLNLFLDTDFIKTVQLNEDEEPQRYHIGVKGLFTTETSSRTYNERTAQACESAGCSSCIVPEHFELSETGFTPRNPVVISQDALKFINSEKIDREITQTIRTTCGCFAFKEIKLDILFDYESDLQQICFSIHLEASYENLVKLREQFNQRFIQLSIPIEKEKYFVFDYEREEPDAL